MRSIRQSGFTLLEIMLVVVLISFTVTMVNLVIEPNPKLLMQQEAARFKALIQQAMDESVLTGNPMLVEVDSEQNSYRFLQIEDDKWLVIEDDELFIERYLPANIQMDFEVINIVPRNEDEETRVQPDRVILEPVGSSDHFKLVLSNGEDQITVKTVGDGSSLEIE